MWPLLQWQQCFAFCEVHYWCADTVSLIKEVPGVQTLLLGENELGIWCGLPEAWVVWWAGLMAWRQGALTGKTGMIRSRNRVHAGQHVGFQFLLKPGKLQMWALREASGNEHRDSGGLCGWQRGNCLLIQHQTYSQLLNPSQDCQRRLYYITLYLCLHSFFLKKSSLDVQKQRT